MDLDTMHGFFDGMPEPLVVMDSAGLVQAANKAWFALAGERGLDSGQAGLNCNYLSILPQLTGQSDQDAAAAAAGLRSVLQGQRPMFHCEYPCRSRGDQAWCMLRASAFSHRATAYVVVVHADISQLKLELERERMTRLEQERKLRETIEESGRFKDQFYAVVAHELRNPANSIIGWTRILQKGPDETVVRHGLDVIYRNSLSLLRTLKDFLDAFSIARGTLEITPVPFDFSDEVELAAESVKPEASEKKLSVILDSLPSGCIVLADRDRIHQVLCNLLLNAIKFSREEGNIRVGISRTDREVMVEVSDSGLGIPPQVLPHIFEPFRQLTPKYGGLGLGLMVARSLVELHGGTISAHSEGEGKGAAFTIRLPLISAGSQPE